MKKKIKWLSKGLGEQCKNKINFFLFLNEIVRKESQNKKKVLKYIQFL